MSLGSDEREAGSPSGEPTMQAESVRFGLFLLAPRYPGQDHTDVLDGAVEAAVAAERAGFDDVWVAEHHFMDYGVCPSAITMAGYLLGATTSIGVGTAVSVLPSTHPVALAEQAALLDRLSHGRFRLGVGRGGPWAELAVFGTGPDRYENGYGADLDRLLDALGTGRVGEGLSLVPPVATLPPVLTAVTSEIGLDVAAQRRLPMLLGMHIGDVEKAAMVQRYEERAPGPDPGHTMAGIAHLAGSRDDAVAQVRSELPRWLGPGLAGYRRADGAPTTPRDPLAYTDQLCRDHPVGDVAHCVDTMVRSIDRTGIRRLMLMVHCTAGRERALETVAALGSNVLPAVRAHALAATTSSACTNGIASASSS